MGEFFGMSLPNLSPFNLPGYQVRFLQSGDLIALQDLLERCSDYNELVKGEPPGPSDAYSLLHSLPEGKGFEDKFVLGIYTGSDELIGVLDTVRDYPENSSWWLGLLLLDPMYRNKGLGREIYTSYEVWAKHLGAEQIYLGVVEPNEKGYHFWQHVGFETIDKRPAGTDGKRVSAVIVMEKHLSE